MGWRKSRGRNRESQFRLESLEPRLLLSADVLPLSTDLQDSTSSPAALAEPIIRPLVEEAVHRLSGLGYSSADLDKARDVRVTIADLPGWTIAETSDEGITLDDDAGGFDWYVDSTPSDDSEFAGGDDGMQAIEGSDAEGRVDLLTVVTHELGHYLGLTHEDAISEATAFMQPGTRPGMRTLPRGHAVQAEEPLTDAVTAQLIETLKAANAPPENSQLTITPTISWNTDANGFWDVATNWLDSLGVSRVPNATDDVLIDRGPANPVITIRSAQSFNNLLANESLTVSSTTVTINGEAEFNAPSSITSSTISGLGTLTNVTSLTVRNVTMNAALVNQGTLVVLDTGNAINGAFTTVSGSILRLLSDGNINHVTLNVNTAGGLSNNATIELTEINHTGLASTLNVNNGSLVNMPGATISVLAGSGGSRALGVQLDNRGTLSIQQNTTMGRAGADHLNSGTIDMTLASLTISQTGTTPSFANTGTLTIGSNRTLSITGGTFSQLAGSISGAGTLSLSNLTANFTTDFSNSQTNLTLSSVTVNGPGTLTNATSLTVRNVTMNAPLVNQGTLVVLDTGNAINGAFTTVPGSILRLLSDGNINHATLNVNTAGGLTNNATIELTEINHTGLTSTLNVNNGSLVNMPGATISVLAGSGGSRTLGVQLDNRGTLSIQQNMTLGTSGADHLNSGTIDMTLASLTISLTGVTPSFANTGTLTIGSNRTLSITGGTFSQLAGSISGAGTLSLSNLTANFTTDFSNSQTNLTLSSVTVNGPGTLTNATSLTVRNVTMNAPLVNQGTLVVLDTGNAINGAFTTVPGSILRLLSDGNINHATLNVNTAGGLTNNATIELTEINHTGLTSTLNVNNGSLVNMPGATISVLAGSGGSRTLGVQLDNRGTLSIQQNMTLGTSGADHLNSGTIDMT